MPTLNNVKALAKKYYCKVSPELKEMLSVSNIPIYSNNTFRYVSVTIIYVDDEYSDVPNDLYIVGSDSSVTDSDFIDSASFLLYAIQIYQVYEDYLNETTTQTVSSLH